MSLIDGVVDVTAWAFNKLGRWNLGICLSHCPPLPRVCTVSIKHGQPWTLTAAARAVPGAPALTPVCCRLVFFAQARGEPVRVYLLFLQPGRQASDCIHPSTYLDTRNPSVRPTHPSPLSAVQDCGCEWPASSGKTALHPWDGDRADATQLGWRWLGLILISPLFVGGSVFPCCLWACVGGWMRVRGIWLVVLDGGETNNRRR